jgi:WD40 repeat protein
MSLEGHGGAVMDAMFSPDGTLVATSSEDGFARVWDAQTGYLVMPFKASGRINGIAFRPADGMLLALATSHATTLLLDIPAETRPPEEISAIVGRESNWLVQQGKLIRKAAIAHTAAPGESKGSAGAERVLRTPEDVVNAFISALEGADNEAITGLLAKNHKFWSLIRADADERLRFAKLFQDCKIAGTEFRSDQLAAMTTLACPVGELAIWTVKEGDGWKFQNFGSRAKADEKAK